MIINKVTIGFVVQTFDTETSKFTKQSFTAGDEVSYENDMGEPVDEDEYDIPYLPFDMVQPS